MTCRQCRLPRKDWKEIIFEAPTGGANVAETQCLCGQKKFPGFDKSAISDKRRAGECAKEALI
jgi:hypothetical protein